jgi:hypothetical protein
VLRAFTTRDEQCVAIAHPFRIETFGPDAHGATACDAAAIARQEQQRVVEVARVFLRRLLNFIRERKHLGDRTDFDKGKIFEDQDTDALGRRSRIRCFIEFACLGRGDRRHRAGVGRTREVEPARLVCVFHRLFSVVDSARRESVSHASHYTRRG